ncbi:MAG: DUF302 domain-containing protein [Lentisphaeria bacterium]|nr:DUF302 domain-containing protein [Lentisphaeria bacterium]
MSICEKILSGKNREKNSLYVALFAGFVIGIGAMFLAGILFLRNDILPEYECKYSFEEMVKLLPENVAKNPLWLCRKVQCGMPKMQEGERIQIFELCSSKYAAKLLKEPESRKIGSMIPCKIAIYEKNGKVYLCRLNLPLFTRIVGGNTAEVFYNDIIPEQKAMLYGLLK